MHFVIISFTRPYLDDGDKYTGDTQRADDEEGGVTQYGESTVRRSDSERSKKGGNVDGKYKIKMYIR